MKSDVVNVPQEVWSRSLKADWDTVERQQLQTRAWAESCMQDRREVGAQQQHRLIEPGQAPLMLGNHGRLERPGSVPRHRQPHRYRCGEIGGEPVPGVAR